MKNLVFVFALSLSANSAMADDCVKLTSLVGENWNTITGLVNICKDNSSYEAKDKAWRLAAKTFELITRTGNLCVQQCANYPDNLRYCRESNNSVLGFRRAMYPICN